MPLEFGQSETTSDRVSFFAFSKSIVYWRIYGESGYMVITTAYGLYPLYVTSRSDMGYHLLGGGSIKEYCYDEDGMCAFEIAISVAMRFVGVLNP